MSTLNDKLKGMFVGLAVGDMLGTTTEGLHYGSFKKITKPEGDGPHSLPLGYWTDDTSQALILADSLLQYQGYNSYDIMNRMWLWRSQGHRSSTGRCFDVGNQTSEAINQYVLRHGYVPSGVPRTTQAGNGCIMRLSPVVIASYERRTKEEIIKMARLSALETHYSDEAETATEVFADLLIKAVEAKKKDEVLAERKPNPLDRFVATAEDLIVNGVEPSPHTQSRIKAKVLEAKKFKESELVNSGYVIHSLQVAVWAFHNFNSFKKGMLAVANLGGDSDTNCAIYGQLAGAYWGYSSIPKQWLKVLYLKEEICRLADDLIDLPSCPILMSRFEGK
jgi:ADP-ribosyl-[dinitrogen reductase] hydrolase